MDSQKKKFYITTAIPYVNAKPHLGHAFEFILADVVARAHRTRGEDVILLSGSDDNALKNVQAAERAHGDVQSFVAVNTKLFQDLARALNVQFDVFQNGSDQAHHFPSSQKLWELCEAAGDIYKKQYSGLYCIGCEQFYTPDELNERGECFEHPGTKLEIVSEENYFFRLSRYQEQLKDLITSDTLAIVPETRKNEILSFLKEPLQDISISRSNERAKNWGVPVPGDPAQRMYVWFDALNIYQSGIGFGWDGARYSKWWPADVHVIGKGIIRFHAVYWPAFLMSAKLALPKKLFVHGYITVEGEKMSKSIGNVVDPVELIAKYGVDAVRYYLLREIPAGDDGDFSIAKFKERYNGELANGIGNLISRVSALGERVSPITLTDLPKSHDVIIQTTRETYKELFAAFNLHAALATAWSLIGVADRYVNDAKPWTIKDEAELRKAIAPAILLIDAIADMAAPFLPSTEQKIRAAISVAGGIATIKKGAAIFPRLNVGAPEDPAIHTA